MAMTLDQQLQAFDTTAALRRQCQAALYVAANAALVEAPATTNHANRVILAKQILFVQSGQYIDAAFRVAIAANAATATLAALQAGVADSAVQPAVQAAFDAMANGG